MLIDYRKLHGTSLIRIETEKLWRELKIGNVIDLNLKQRKESRNKQEKIKVEKYKIISKAKRTILMLKISNNIKETFTFNDFIAGDVSI